MRKRRRPRSERLKRDADLVSDNPSPVAIHRAAVVVVVRDAVWCEEARAFAGAVVVRERAAHGVGDAARECADGAFGHGHDPKEVAVAHDQRPVLSVGRQAVALTEPSDIHWAINVLTRRVTATHERRHDDV